MHVRLTHWRPTVATLCGALALAGACHPTVTRSNVVEAVGAAEPGAEIRPQAQLGDGATWMGLPVYQDRDLYQAIRQWSTGQGIAIETVTIEQVIGLLPAEMRDNFTLVYDSGSLQVASTDDPRAILFMRNGSFVAAFNNDQNPGHRDTLEFLQYKTRPASARRVSQLQLTCEKDCPVPGRLRAAKRRDHVALRGRDVIATNSWIVISSAGRSAAR